MEAFVNVYLYRGQQFTGRAHWPTRTLANQAAEMETSDEPNTRRVGLIRVRPRH